MQRLYLMAIAPALFAIASSFPHKPGSIQGTWQTVEVTLRGPTGARAVTNLQPNLMIVTGKHYSRVEIHAEGPRPVVADVGHASADELRALWGPFIAEAGTYDVKDNVITMRPIVSKNPAEMRGGTFSTYSFRAVGDTIWVTPKSTEKGPVNDAPTIKAVRVE